MQSQQQALKDGGYALSIELGEKLPDFKVWLQSDTGAWISGVVDGHVALIAFCDIHSEFALDLIEYLELTVTPKLRENSKIVLCFDSSQAGAVFSSYEHKANGQSVALLDLTNFSSQYNLRIIPSMLCVDNEGIVDLTQIGFSGILDRKILDFLMGDNLR